MDRPLRHLRPAVFRGDAFCLPQNTTLEGCPVKKKSEWGSVLLAEPPGTTAGAEVVFLSNKGG